MAPANGPNGVQAKRLDYALKAGCGMWLQNVAAECAKMSR